MNTPIVDFVRAYADKNTVRAHMPGHKGIAPEKSAFPSAYKYDITEIKGADALFTADGIIAQSEKNATLLFNTYRTIYSCGGSTLCIQTMLSLVCRPYDTVIAVRNAHSSFINSCALLSVEPFFVYPDYDNGSVVSGEITPESIEQGIIDAKWRGLKVSAVYVTSPDYLGRIADIKSIAEISHRYGLPLLVDNAHGAYTSFLEKSLNPCSLGADMCCESAHKTLPVLTGGAYLHIMNKKYAVNAKRNMSLFGSTSPSYLILQSLDLCNRYIADGLREDLYSAVENTEKLKNSIKHIYSVCDTEPLKLTIYTLPCGLYGYELAERLRENNIECEYADSTHIVLMFSVSSSESDFERTKKALLSVRMPKILLKPPVVSFPHPEKAVSVREAMFAESEKIPVEKSCGRICAEPCVVIPPCIPVCLYGEVIDDSCINILKNYSIFEVNVIK